MKRTVIFITAVLLSLSCLAFAVNAEKTSYWYYSDGVNYMVFYDDGTGYSFDNYCQPGYFQAYTFKWHKNGENISFTDCEGRTFNGVITEDDRLSGTVDGYSVDLAVNVHSPFIFQLDPENIGKGLDYVTDYAGILTSAERAKLNETAKKYSEELGCGIYFVSVQYYNIYSERYDIESFAEELRACYDIGGDNDAVLLVISMNYRDYDLFVHGNTANGYFSDHGRRITQNAFLDDFADDDWCSGISDYIEQTASIIEYGKENGRPFSEKSDYRYYLILILVAAATGVLIGLVFCLIVKSGMKQVKEKTDADGYLKKGGFVLTAKSDRYLRTSVSRVYIPKNSGSGGGHSGGGHRGGGSFGGHSHSSGHF